MGGQQLIYFWHMPKSFEDLDFTKQEHREEFRKYSELDQLKIINAAQNEADKLTLLIQTGAAKTYQEAYERLKEIENVPPGWKVIISPDHNIYLDAGGGRTLLGNVMEGAESTNEQGMYVVDITRVEENTDRIMKMVDDLLFNKPQGGMS